MSGFEVPLLIAGTVVSAVGAVRSAQAQAGAANYNAQLAAQNAQIADAQGNAAADAQQRDAARKIGSAVALYGASGVQTDTGSPADVLSDSVRNATLDNLTIKYNAKLRAMGYQEQSALDRSNASNATSAGYLSATSQLLSGGAKAYSMGQGGANASASATGTPSFG